MRGNISSQQLDDHDEAWSEIELLVEEAAKLAHMSMSSREFHCELAKRLAQATCAHSTVIWSRCEDGTFTIDATVGESTMADNDEVRISRSRNVAAIAEQSQARVLAPQQTGDVIENNTSHTLAIRPVLVDDKVVAVIETYLDEVVGPSETANTVQVISVFSDLIAEFHRNCQLRELRNRETSWTDQERFVEQVHRSLDLKRTAFAIANEATSVTSCDRITVFQLNGSRCKTLAISGIDTFDRRSPQVRSAEKLALAVALHDEPLWYPCDDEALPTQIEKRLQAYLDTSHSRSVAVVGLSGKAEGGGSQQVGVALIERFDGDAWSDCQKRRVDFVCRHGAGALINAKSLAGLPLIGINRSLDWCLRVFSLQHVSKTLTVLMLLVAAILSAVYVPVDFDIHGEGQLVPSRYRHVFAPADGIIDQLDVRHAQTVSAGKSLIQLRRPDLEYEETRVLGEILANQKRLATVHSALLNNQPGSADSQNEFHELTAEKEQLVLLLKSLQEQQAILSSEREALNVTSPLDGEVITWGIEDQLTQRPVKRGERLVSVADTNGPWHLDLRIADRDIEHVLAAQRDAAELSVSFVVASDSGHTYRGYVEHVSMATELDEFDQPSVLVRVAFESSDVPDLRPGASVYAKVHCGERSVGYVWLRELIDVVKTRVLF